MTNPNESKTPESTRITFKQDLLELCDTYKELQHYCAFFCKSSSVLIHQCSADLDESCTEGVARFAQMLIEKSNKVDSLLKQLLHRV